ncbi:MAG: hypothetical protein WBA44_18590 [Mesorhizobium sp.]
MTAATKTDKTVTEAGFGPAEGIAAPAGARGAMLTLVLALYPVVAAIMVMMAGLAVAAPH